MKNSLGKFLVQTQQLKMTPSMVQYLKLLKVPGVDLEKYIEEELRDNPMLEKYFADSEEDKEQNAGTTIEPDTINKVIELPDNNYYRSFNNTYNSSNSNFNGKNSASILNYIKKDTTLKEHLHEQLGVLKMQDIHRKIAEFMIESIDDRGYLRETTSELITILNVDKKDVRIALKILQGLDPPGIGARNIKECLIIQLRKKQLLNEENKLVILHYFDQLVEKKFTDISKKTRISVEQIDKIYRIIKDLNPRPGASFASSNWKMYIVPDVILVESGEGEYSAQYNDETEIRIKINNDYKNYLKDPASSPETKEYIREGILRATNFIKAVEQRKKTILDIIDYLVKYQADFLREGKTKIKPLTMKEVADALGISESTVSRTVNGKYIQTSKGVLEFKDFLSTNIGDQNGDAVSAAGTKELVRKIIGEEDKNKPLSDEQIRKKLSDLGVKIARRTVAKYREELGILPSHMRKSGYV